MRASRATSVRLTGPPRERRCPLCRAVRSLVATGSGVAVLPDLAYRPWSLEGDRIEACEIEEILPDLTVGVAWRKGSPLPQVAETFIDLAVTQRRNR